MNSPSPHPGLPAPNKSATEIAEVPELQRKKFDPVTAWSLYYRSGNNPHPRTKIFCFAGTVRDAVDRAKSHCTNMNLRFISIEPWLSDLDYDERFLNREH